MNPLFFLAPMVLLRGRTKKKGKKPRAAAPAVPPRARRAASRSVAAKPRKRNGKLRTVWTAFPWQPDRVTEVARQLVGKGVTDPDNLTVAVAKTVYPIHPVSGAEFTWPPIAEDGVEDVGARMIWDRLRLRVNTMLAADEERRADEATAHAEQAQAAPTPEPEDDPETEGQDEDESEDDEGSEAEKEPEPASPRIGRASPVPFPKAAQPATGRSRLTLNRRRTMRRRPDPYGYHPEDNALRGGVFHTVQPAETVTAVASGVLQSYGIAEPTGAQVARYVSLVISAPYNDSLKSVWDDEHDLPGAPPFPWGAERPTIWLPRLNEAQVATGIVTTLGADWDDGSNGLNPPPRMKARED